MSIGTVVIIMVDVNVLIILFCPIEIFPPKISADMKLVLGLVFNCIHRLLIEPQRFFFYSSWLTQTLQSNY